MVLRETAASSFVGGAGLDGSGRALRHDEPRTDAAHLRIMRVAHPAGLVEAV